MRQTDRQTNSVEKDRLRKKRRRREKERQTEEGLEETEKER